MSTSDDSTAPAPTGVELIAAERRRQIDFEGYTAEHDAEHPGQLAFAAENYAHHAALQARYSCSMSDEWHGTYWPWGEEAWKPAREPLGNLVKAGALAAAEIDRILASQTPGPQVTPAAGGVAEKVFPDDYGWDDLMTLVDAHWPTSIFPVAPDAGDRDPGPRILSLVRQLAQRDALLRELVDPDPCRFDHHGGCQAHGHLEPEPGEACPHAAAKALLREVDS